MPRQLPRPFPRPRRLFPPRSTTPTLVATAEPPAVSTESAATSAAADGDDVVFEAPGRNALETLASGSWSFAEDTLVNPGSSATAEPWLVLSAVPSADFAVEAEMRVTGSLESVCDQSFGLVGGSPGAGQVYGGGLIFPCASDTTRARLTDVSLWEDGYNADSVLAEKKFDPGNEWHTYRFELRGDELRLLVDGADVVSGTAGDADRRRVRGRASRSLGTGCGAQSAQGLGSTASPGMSPHRNRPNDPQPNRLIRPEGTRYPALCDGRGALRFAPGASKAPCQRDWRGDAR